MSGLPEIDLNDLLFAIEVGDDECADAWTGEVLALSPHWSEEQFEALYRLPAQDFLPFTDERWVRIPQLADPGRVRTVFRAFLARTARTSPDAMESIGQIKDIARNAGLEDAWARHYAQWLEATARAWALSSGFAIRTPMARRGAARLTLVR